MGSFIMNFAKLFICEKTLLHSMKSKHFYQINGYNIRKKGREGHLPDSGQ